MPEKSQVFEQKVKHKGFFDFRELYNFCYEWLKDEHFNVAEEEYTEKISSIGKEIVIKWTAKKKISDYFRQVVSLKWHIIGMADAEVEVSGKKQKTNKGDLKIEIKAELERDYEKRWEDKPLNKFFRGIYDRYIIRTTIDEYETRLIEKSDSYYNQIKSFLVLEGHK